ncbi:NAD-dependent epimerase/dehydratase family protein [Kocuria tytonis]|uniref:NAD-dependent epimerase/dehydratase family protein n=1 Tax=Kocuria tytonis TaxID=2054280 RepID=UPI001F226AF9|nr:NAD-dependent epimerase/dehydratase family protein [Kocuria tytonis]
MTDTGSKDVLLAGCGDVGTALGLRVAGRGWRATGVRRHAAQLPAPIHGVSMDLVDPGSVTLPPAEAVVVTLTADGHDAAAYERTYLGGLRGLRRALGTQNPRVVLVSSTGVLGGGDGERVTEETPADPQRPTGHVLLAAEELAAELFPELVVVRPAGIYGPGRTSMIERVRRGSPMAHRRMTNRIHRDDLVTVLTAVLDSPEPPRLLHAVDHDAARLGDVAAHLADRLGVPVPPDDSGPGEGPLGKIVDGALVHSFVPADEWLYPTFREGYDALLAGEFDDPGDSGDSGESGSGSGPGGSGAFDDSSGSGGSGSSGSSDGAVRP